MSYPFDFSDIRGNEAAIAALEGCARDGGAVLLIGLPGSAKTMLARRLLTILPPMTPREQWDTASIYGLTRLPYPVPAQRPFRAPHHTISNVGMFGGGRPLYPRVRLGRPLTNERPLGVRFSPGEASLAHNGVLFLDEAPEFRRATLEHLVTVLRDGVNRLYRAPVWCALPARPRLVIAASPCPCGYHGTRKCECSAPQVSRYQACLDVLRPLVRHEARTELIGYEAVTGPPTNPTSAAIRARLGY